MTQTRTKLIIIGCGAGGLMGGVLAGQFHLPTLMLERRHRPGLKLLMCGNNRCNLSHAATLSEMLASYGEPVGPFLKNAITAFSPAQCRSWFQKAGLPTTVKQDGRIYPASEKADDVLHCFLDNLRELHVPLTLNCPVQSITRLEPNGFLVTTENGLSFEAENLLLATGGVSYPKTGSVGDGQNFAAQCGHTITPLQPGLAGLDIPDGWLANGNETDLEKVRLFIGETPFEKNAIEGNLLATGNILRGSAVFDTSRFIARHHLKNPPLFLDLFPDTSLAQLTTALTGCTNRSSLAATLNRLGLPIELATPLAASLAKKETELPTLLKHIPLDYLAIRPIKEAIVTVGGVSLTEINPLTMESTLCPGLFFAGEVMDIDGPTGGYNLHAAFATARLAISTIAQRCNCFTKNTVFPQTSFQNTEHSFKQYHSSSDDAPRHSTRRDDAAGTRYSTRREDDAPRHSTRRDDAAATRYPSRREDADTRYSARRDDDAPRHSTRRDNDAARSSYSQDTPRASSRFSQKRSSFKGDSSASASESAESSPRKRYQDPRTTSKPFYTHFKHHK